MEAREDPQPEGAPAGATASASARRGTGGNRPVAVDLAVLLGLTLLVWGLFAPARGLWRDDVLFLAVAQQSVQHGQGWAALLEPPVNSPTRVLLRVPFALALWSGEPRVFLQLLYGAVWFGTGVGAYALAAGLFPGRRRLAFAAGALTICATGDFYSMSVGSLHYTLAVLGFVASLACAVTWLRTGRYAWLAGVVLALSASVWMIDAALSSALLAPVLLWVVAGRRVNRRLGTLVGVWLLTLAPYLAVFAGALLDAESYAATRGIVRLTPAEWLARTGHLFSHNFQPWVWTFDRPLFEWNPPRLLPLPVAAGLAAGGTGLFLWRFRSSREAGELTRAAPPRDWTIAGIALLLGLACNGMYAFAQLSHLEHRTHLLSRVWVSLALAVVVDRLLAWRRSAGFAPIAPGRGLAGTALACGFVLFGILGGLERQDYYLSSWRSHQRELASILEAAPGLAPAAVPILVVPRGKEASTHNSRLAGAWLSLLYDRPAFHRRTVAISVRGGGCRPEPEGLSCWEERQRECIEAGTCSGRRVPYERAVVFVHSRRTGKYRLARSLPNALRPPDGSGNPASAYRPDALVEAGPPDPLARSLLGGGELLFRWLPGAAPWGLEEDRS